MKILLGASMYCTAGWGEKQHIVFLYIAGPPYVPLFTKRYMNKVPSSNSTVLDNFQDSNLMFCIKSYVQLWPLIKNNPYNSHFHTKTLNSTDKKRA